MRKTISLAALLASTAGMFLSAAPAHANHCEYVFAVGGAYHDLDEKAKDALPDIVWYCTE